MADFMEEIEDEVPEEFRELAASFAVEEGPLDSEEDYAKRELPQLPPAALLEGLARLWTYPVTGMEPYRALLKSVVENEAFAAYAPALAQLLCALEEYDTPREEIVGATALQLDYTRMFIGSFKMYAPPYASYYMDEDQLVYGPTAAAIDEIYAQFGLALATGECDMPDHLRFIIAFMSLLAARYEETGEADFAFAYEDFRMEFVDPWIGQLAEKLHTYAEYAYFKQLVDFTIAVL